MTFLRSANMKNGRAKQLQPIFIVTTCEPYPSELEPESSSSCVPRANDVRRLVFELFRF